jgi:hypothetical protein
LQSRVEASEGSHQHVQAICVNQSFEPKEARFNCKHVAYSDIHH